MLYIRRKLHCPRNTVHVNLFFSFLLRCVMALVRDLLMADGVGIRGDNISYTDGLRFDHSTSVTRPSLICHLICMPHVCYRTIRTTVVSNETSSPYGQ